MVTPLSHSSRTLYATQGQGQLSNSRLLYRRAGTIYFLGCHLKVTACRREVLADLKWLHDRMLILW
jgi:hypothetical protein